ncbi:MAG: hypothetical protein ACRDIB_17485, partial [Ardenticatenaceae bacterium]
MMTPQEAEERKERAQATEAVVDARDDIVARPAEAPDAVDLAAGYETSDVHLGGVIKAGVALLIFSVATFGVITGFQALTTGRLGDFAPPAEG